MTGSTAALVELSLTLTRQALEVTESRGLQSEGGNHPRLLATELRAFAVLWHIEEAALQTGVCKIPTVHPAHGE